MTRFFKISKKNPGVLQHYTLTADGPPGNTVKGIIKQETREKYKLLKEGDADANETLYRYEIFDDEIEENEGAFAIAREIFSAKFVRQLSPASSPKYKRYYEKALPNAFIGSDYLGSFKTWKEAYDSDGVTILGAKLDAQGDLAFPSQSKRIEGLGVAAVLIELLGKIDRANYNWGLVEGTSVVQVTLIDFGSCMNSLPFSMPVSDEKPAVFKCPRDIISSVFEQYTSEKALPAQLLTLRHIECEVYETLAALKKMPSELIEALANEQFAAYPLYKAALLKELAMGIEYLDNQFRTDKHYIASQYINECLQEIGIQSSLSSYDNESIDYLLELYVAIRPDDNPRNHRKFMTGIRSYLVAEEQQGLTLSFVG
ncbi:hypothetical protein BN59_01901 [Legionella massiliensis]|uniref:Uncharacterized protein n=1 Tax=Legionella massiliensis TaxID=1034943 RepID=A0A078KX49_9GAMM|nr:hypothetical protein [Legionella massiliensis]CDZ77617.1 hypothetical protein BN59_01901 [Legionella massiliensis]CEE13355.1 hypothetical protein BN1094_01901 [Legionella massiliensis]